MAWVPDDAKWWLADLVVVASVGGDTRHVTHVNRTLIRADSRDEAYRRALVCGKQSNQRYRNEAGALVRIRFLGLGELQVLYDGLGHGVEVEYREKVFRSLDKAKALVRPKKALSVFVPWREPPASRLDFVAGSVMKGLREATGFGLRKRRRA